jgi:GNAT superfamily N-acetyltransferase
MQITSASVDCVVEINRLIARSKAYWPWAPGYLAAALPLMAVTPEYIEGALCLEVRDGAALAGFASVVEAPDRRLLDNLWVDPDHIGRGLGRFACEHIFEIARRSRWRELVTLPDPPAEGFYLRMGFQDTGERVPSRIPGGPVFSTFRRRFDHP